MRNKLLYFLLMITASAQAQTVNIPDTYFKNKLLLAASNNFIAKNLGGSYFKIDQNNDGEIQTTEASQVSYLDVSNSNIIHLTGILSFTNLKYLRCEENFMSTLDVSGLTNLETFYCNSNALSTLDVSSLLNLKHLVCYSNQIQTLDLSNLALLEDLTCYTNQLTSLTLGPPTSLLTYINCSENLLSSLDVHGYSAIQYLYCYNNQLTNLNYQGLGNITELRCYQNQLTNLDLSYIPTVKYLDCSSNLLTSLDLSNSTFIQTLNCSANQLSTLNANNCVFINTLNCRNNNLSSLYIKNNRNEAVDFSSNPNIQWICCDNMQLANFQGYTAIYPNLTVTTDCSLSDQSFAVNDLKLYPNPVIDYLYLNSAERIVNAVLYDLSGRVILADDKNTSILNLSGINSGSYILRLWTLNGVHEIKIIKH